MILVTSTSVAAPSTTLAAATAATGAPPRQVAAAAAARPSPTRRRRTRRPAAPAASAARGGSGNRYRELVERDVLPDGSANTPARRLSAAVRDAPSLRALARLRARTGGRGSSAWDDAKHAPGALMRAASLHYYRLAGERGGAAGRLRGLLLAAAAAAAGAGGERGEGDEEGAWRNRREPREGGGGRWRGRDDRPFSSTTVAEDLAALLADLAPLIDRDPRVAKRVEGEKIAQLLVVAWRAGAAIADVRPLCPLADGGRPASGRAPPPRPPPLIPAHAVAPLARELTRSGGRKLPGHAPDLLAELAAALAGLGWRDRRLWLALADAARRALMVRGRPDDDEGGAALAAAAAEGGGGYDRGARPPPPALQAADLAPLAAGVAAAAAAEAAVGGAPPLPAAEARAVLAALARAASRAGLPALLPPGELAVLARAYAMAWGPRAGVAELERGAEPGDGGDDDNGGGGGQREAAAVDVASFVAAIAEEMTGAVRSAEAPGGHDLDAALFAPHWDEEEEEEEEEEGEGQDDAAAAATSVAVGAAFFAGAPAAPPLSLWCATSGWPSAVPPPRDYVDVLEATHGAFGCAGGGGGGGGGSSTAPSSAATAAAAAAARLQRAHAALFAAAAEHVLAARPSLEPPQLAALLRLCASEVEAAAATGERSRSDTNSLFLARRLAARLARAVAAAAPLEAWRPREVAAAAEALAELSAARAPDLHGEEEEEEEEEEDDSARPAAAAAAAARRARAASASAREGDAFSAALRAALAAAAAAAGPSSWPLAELVAVLCAGVRGLAAAGGSAAAAAQDDPLLLLVARAAAAGAAAGAADAGGGGGDRPSSPPPLTSAAQADLLWALSRVRGLRTEREQLLTRLAAAAAAAVGG
jgi:hypothetical protein